MPKKVGIQKQLNEIAEALTVNGFEVTNMIDTEDKLDAIIYYNDEGNSVGAEGVLGIINTRGDNQVLKINAAETNIDEIMKILDSLE